MILVMTILKTMHNERRIYRKNGVIIRQARINRIFKNLPIMVFKFNILIISLIDLNPFRKSFVLVKRKMPKSWKLPTKDDNIKQKQITPWWMTGIQSYWCYWIPPGIITIGAFRCLAGRMAMHACQIGPTDTAPPCPGPL